VFATSAALAALAALAVVAVVAAVVSLLAGRTQSRLVKSRRESHACDLVFNTSK
jgi:hypothetical protein